VNHGAHGRVQASAVAATRQNAKPHASPSDWSDTFPFRQCLARIGAGDQSKEPTVDDPVDQDALKRRLQELRSEHRDLDDVIARISEQVPFDQLQVQRLKKRKLQLKDEIAKIESALLPDIIA